MTTALAHRGPDGQSQWRGGDVGLGHTRLAIIDVEGGHQPMHSAGGHTVVVFNGEIYNYRELKARLEQLGYVFRTRSDTEVIWAAIDAWGLDEGLLSLRGMFALALYDLRTRRLLLARDRVGIKPLYWAETPGSVLFGSEPKALLASGVLSRRIDPIAIHDFLGHGYPTTPATCWKDIRMLEPGTWLEAGPDGIRRGRYWQWAPCEDSGLGLEAAVDATRAALVDAARAHLVSDVRVGAFLSGGLDSALLVRLISPSLQADLPTFNVGFDDASHDESAAARSVAVLCGTDHHELRVANQDGDPDLFDWILDQFDEPFGDSSCIPVYLICREMRRHVKVVLSGDGGDEVLGGYPQYLHARRLQSLARWNAATAPLAPLMPVVRRLGTSGRQIEKAWRFAHLPPLDRLAALQTYFTEDERAALYRPEFAVAALGAGPTSWRLAGVVDDGLADPAQQLVTAEMRLRLHADYLRKVDVASAAHGVEVRVPYLDPVMLDLAARLPIRLKIAADGGTKVIARHLARELLPPSVAQAPKRGFTIPLDRWMGPAMHAHLRRLLVEPGAPIGQLLDPAAVRRVWDDFESGRAGVSRYQRSQRVFFLASLARWLERWSPSPS